MLDLVSLHRAFAFAFSAAAAMTGNSASCSGSEKPSAFFDIAEAHLILNQQMKLSVDYFARVAI